MPPNISGAEGLKCHHRDFRERENDASETKKRMTRPVARANTTYNMALQPAVCDRPRTTRIAAPHERRASSHG